MGYLIDSNVLIDYMAERFTQPQLVKLDALFDSELNISVITQIETLGFKSTADEAQKMIAFLQAANIIALDENVVQRTISLRKTLRIKTPDAIIAATALVNGYTLLSRNLADFTRVQNLKVVSPHDW